MSRMFFSAALAPYVAVAVAISTLAPASAQPPASRMAPADEYFGPLKMSIIGIRNDLRDSLARLDGASADERESASRHAALVETAVREWEAKYPDDTWLPRTLLALHRVYLKAANGNTSHALAVTAWLVHRYPDAPETSAVRSELGAPTR